MNLSRRDFTTTIAAITCSLTPLKAAPPKTHHADLTGRIGITTGSFSRHFSKEQRPDKIRLLDLPAMMRDELDMHVLDLMTANVPSFEPTYLSKLRDRAEQAGCILTNLKMNQKGIDMGSPDPETRRKAIESYKLTIESASLLGCRWVRPLPMFEAPDFNAYVQSYRELIEFAADKGITLLMENFGWIQDDPDAIPRTIKAVGEGLAASIDTGNWTDRARYEGLQKAYPLAVTCDFKAKGLGKSGEHDAYDLERCFQIGWEVGYRGPWFFEHTNPKLAKLTQDLVMLRDMLRKWAQQQ
jgi:hypothetical protein